MAFSDVSKGRDNNLNLLRFLAASMVVLSHSLALYSSNQYDLLLQQFRLGYGDTGVDIFFVISGFLITKSWLRKNNLVDFCWARFLRIFPALWFSTLAFVVVCAAFFTPLPFLEFLSLDSTLSYLAHNVSMLPMTGAQLDLPMAIDGWQGEFNIPLWTLPHELQMYALVVLLGITGLLRYRWLCVLVFLASLAIWIAADLGLMEANSSRYRLMFHFFAGAATVQFSRHLSFSWLPATIAAVFALAAALSLPPSIAQYGLALATPVIVFWFGYYPDFGMRAFNRIGDYSYGIYIFGYPIQTIYYVYYGDTLGVAGHTAISFLTILVFAIASWHILESRLLKSRLPASLTSVRAWIASHVSFLNTGILRKDSPNHKVEQS